MYNTTQKIKEQKKIECRTCGLARDSVRALEVIMEAMLQHRDRGLRCYPWRAFACTEDVESSLLCYVQTAQDSDHVPQSFIWPTHEMALNMTAALDLHSSFAAAVAWVAPVARARLLVLRTTHELLHCAPLHVLSHDRLRNAILTQVYWYPACLADPVWRRFQAALGSGLLDARSLMQRLAAAQERDELTAELLSEFAEECRRAQRAYLAT